MANDLIAEDTEVARLLADPMQIRKMVRALRERDEQIVQAVEAETQYEAAIRERDEQLATACGEIVEFDVQIRERDGRIAECADLESYVMRSERSLFAELGQMRGLAERAEAEAAKLRGLLRESAQAITDHNCCGAAADLQTRIAAALADRAAT